MEENVFYKPGEPSSVMSLNEEVDLFASCVNIYTRETDVYGDIMDEPRELEVFDEGAWALNLATGIVATLGLAACAIAVVATGGAALAVVAFASAAVGTGVMTAGMSYADKKNQKNRSNLEYGIGLMLGAAVGALTGVGIMYAGPALTVAGEQAGFEASFLMGTNALTVSTIPDIVTAGEMTLLATDGAYALNEINTMCTGQNLAVDTVFEGNEENYEACVVALQVLNDGLLDLTTRGYQRNGSGSSSSEAEKSDEGAEISESGVNIRGAGDESGIDSVYDIVKGVENGDVPLSNNIQKGNYGEMKMDVYFKSQGYERISLDRVTDLNTPTHHGIDGVYYNPDGHPPYIIGEAKYGSSRLSILADGTPQMSDKWIIDRLENAVGEEIANDIKMEMILNPDNVGSTLFHVSSDGGIDITELIDGIKQENEK